RGEPHGRGAARRRRLDRIDPAHDGGHHAGRSRRRRPRQPGSGSRREVRATADGKGRPMNEELSEVDRTVFGTIEDALEDIRAGKVILVVDDADRENEGDFVIAAERCTPDAVNFMVTHGRGIVCLPVSGWRLDELQIPQMVSSTGGDDTAFTVSIDYRPGVTTRTTPHHRPLT